MSACPMSGWSNGWRFSSNLRSSASSADSLIGSGPRPLSRWDPASRERGSARQVLPVVPIAVGRSRPRLRWGEKMPRIGLTPEAGGFPVWTTGWAPWSREMQEKPGRVRQVCPEAPWSDRGLGVRGWCVMEDSAPYASGPRVGAPWSREMQEKLGRVRQVCPKAPWSDRGLGVRGWCVIEDSTHPTRLQACNRRRATKNAPAPTMAQTASAPAPEPTASSKTHAAVR